MKKTLIIASLLIMGILPAFSQQLPLFSLYRENNFILNPAIAGSENHAIGALSFRQQWTKVNGAPQTFSASYRTPIKKSNLGVGVHLVNDVTGPTSFTGLTATVSYHISFEKINPFRWPSFLRNSKIALGLSGSVYQYRLNSNSLILDQPNDNAINVNAGSRWMPNAGVGVYYYYDLFFLGFSVPNVIPFNVQFDQDNTTANLKRSLHYYTTVGAKIPFYGRGYKPKFYLEPMVWFRYVKNAPYQLDGNLRFRYKNLFWVGAGYRSLKTFTCDAGVMIKDHIAISYAYDQSMLDVQSYIGGTHELVVAYHFDAKKRYKRYR